MNPSADDMPASGLNASALTGVQYQQLVFERLLATLALDPRVVAVENHAQGPVDYIVHEPAGAGMLGKARRHYFECKNYGRALELDNVAKIMVVAVAEQPDSVHVVSRTRLQPQITTYAARLFDIGTDGSPIFRSISFRHWQTDDRLNLIASRLAGSGRDSADVRLPSWWISECEAYLETMLASSSHETRRLLVRRGSLLLLTIELHHEPVDHASLDGLPSGTWEPSGSQDRASSRRTFVIDTALLDADHAYRLTAHVGAGGDQTGLPLVELQVEGHCSTLPELRPQAVKDLIDSVGPAGQRRLVLVDGEAGVGKTHFIERATATLRARFGFEVACFTVTQEHQHTLLATLLNACLTPPLEAGSFKEVAEAVQRSLLAGEADVRALEANVALLARVAARMGPRVIVVRDCHLLEDAVANQLWALIVAFDDAGWGGARLVLESRQPDAAENAAFQGLLKRVRKKVRRELLTRTLTALTGAELSAAAGNIFPHVTPEIVSCLTQRTGGLPLLLDGYLHRLLDLGIVERRSGQSRPLVIAQPARLLADVVPSGTADILQERVASSLRKAFGEPSPVATQLGLIALCDNALMQAGMRQALSISPASMRALQLALDQAGLAAGRPDGELAFRHDLIRVALIAHARAQADFADTARATADRLLEDSALPDLGVRRLRAQLFAATGDRVSLEVELRLGANAARDVSDYGYLAFFLAELIDLLPEAAGDERLDLLSGLAWAAWVSDSLLVARQRYLDLAELALRSPAADFSVAEAAATDALRRAIGIDLELMEPLAFLRNALAVIQRRQTHVTFNSILNRLVLFCARFGFPKEGFELAELGFNYLGEGLRQNEGAVLCSELGAMYATASPGAALTLFRDGVRLAQDDTQRAYNQLDMLALETLHLGKPLDPVAFDKLWHLAAENRFAEVMTRASLLRGSVCLREGDLLGAKHWINRTWTLVNLYHLKEFELPALNDLMLLSLLQGDVDQAKRYLGDFCDQFDLLVQAYGDMVPLVRELASACAAAADKLAVEPSSLARPTAPPEHCGVFFGLWRNVLSIAPSLDATELVARYGPTPPWLPPADGPGGGANTVRCIGLELAVGAY